MKLTHQLKNIINNGGNIIYNCLLNKNVTDVFIYSGGSIMPIIDKLYKSRINYYVNTHEQFTGHSATGYAKTSNKTGIAMVTSGPGITNMITPILDAKNDSIPLIVFSGQVSLSSLNKNSFQEAPSVQLTNHITKWSYQVKNINELEYVIYKAFRIANDRKKGPVHIDIPKCVSYQKLVNFCSRGDRFKLKLQNKLIYTDIKRVASVINNSKKPILLLGKGSRDASKQIREFANNNKIPVISTIFGCGVYDENLQLSLGWCGQHGNPAANYTIQNADLIIALGNRFDDRTTGSINTYAKSAKIASKQKTGGIIHVNIDKKELGFVIKSDYNFNIDCTQFIEQISPYIEQQNRTEWLNNCFKLKENYPFVINKHETKLHMEDVLDTFNRYTSDKDCIFTTGVGNHQMQAYQFIKSQYHSKIISSGSLGVMGTGLPYSIGAQIANPQKIVINIDGDSSFNMSLSELKTIQEYNLPIKIAIMNNSSQMMVSTWEKLFFNSRYTATINKKNPNYKCLGNSFGIHSIKCNDRKQLDKTIDYFLSYNDGPILCEFKIEPDICLPLVGPGESIDNMILPNSQTTRVQKTITGLVPS